MHHSCTVHVAEEISKLVEAGILWDVVVNTPALVRAVVLHPLSSIEHVLVAIGEGLPGIPVLLCVVCGAFDALQDPL